MAPNALTGYLAQFAPHETDYHYVEVAYFQAGEKPQMLRRALVPVYRRTALEPGWSRIASRNHAFVPDVLTQAKTMMAFSMMRSRKK
ncbi:MAG TPA: hypothetical protein VGM74_18355 [Burkholderiaceae bacterium]